MRQMENTETEADKIMCLCMAFSVGGVSFVVLKHFVSFI